MNAFSPGSAAARPGAKVIPIAEVRGVSALVFQRLLLFSSQFLRSGRQESREVRHSLPLGGYLPHEASDFFKVRLVCSRKLPVVSRANFIKYRGSISVVLFEMSVQVRLLTEASLAKRTLERLLLVVDVPDVSLEVAGDAEGPLAVLALVGLLPGVGSQVPGQVCASGKDFPAEFARVPVFGLQSGVSHCNGVRVRVAHWSRRRRRLAGRTGGSG